MAETPHSLLERLRSNPADSPSWNEFLALYTPFLHAWLRRLASLQHHDADDLVQNILTVVVRKLPAFQHNRQPGVFRSWLRNILVHCLQEWRRSHSRVVTDEARIQDLQDPHSDLSQLFDEEYRGYVFRRLVEGARDKFPGATAEIFEQVVLQGNSPAQVAAQRNVSVNVVYLAKSRVLRWLRTEGQGLLDD